MTSSSYILCPGQGAQAVSMGRDLAQASAAARAVYARADEVLNYQISAICFEGPEDRLNQTNISQPAIFTTSVASYQAAVEARRVDPGALTAIAGLSLGEYTALHLAGAFSFEDGLRLVAARGQYMQEAATANPSGMVAVMGGDEAAVRQLCQTVAEGEVLAPANFNAPGQIVVSGTRTACERLTAAAEAAGLKATPLKVAGAFHSALMRPAADRMESELSRIALAPPRIPVYSNVTAEPHTTADAMRRLLVEQIVSPVRWEQTMRPLMQDAAAQFFELAPGRTLTGLAKRINRRLTVESLATADAFAKV